MIALKSVKTLPATMLEVEREEVSGGGPSLRSRCCRLGAREALRRSFWRRPLIRRYSIGCAVGWR